MHIFILNKPEYVFKKLRNISGLIPLSLYQKGNLGLWNNPLKVKSSPVAEQRLTPVPPDLIIFTSYWVITHANGQCAESKGSVNVVESI